MREKEGNQHRLGWQASSNEEKTRVESHREVLTNHAKCIHQSHHTQEMRELGH